MDTEANINTQASLGNVAGPSLADRIKKGVVAATAALVGVPALINAAYDVGAAFLNVPRTESERLNAELYQKYIHKDPVVMMPIAIKSSYGETEVKFYIYDEGDVNVEYAGRTQWFALPKATPTRSIGLSFFSTANAAPVVIRPTVRPVIKPIASQRSTLQGTTLVRKQVFADGTFQEDKIDIRTGNIMNVTTGIASPSPAASTPAQQVFSGVIDLEKLRSGSGERK
jgi:hypothetical protein